MLYNQRVKGLSISQLIKAQDKNSKKKKDSKHNHMLTFKIAISGLLMTWNNTEEARKCWCNALSYLSSLSRERYWSKAKEESFLIKCLVSSKVIWSWISRNSIFLHIACWIEKQGFYSLSLIPVIYEYHSLCLTAFPSNPFKQIKCETWDYATHPTKI